MQLDKDKTTVVTVPEPVKAPTIVPIKEPVKVPDKELVPVRRQA
jgi:hypothetical protein